MSFLSFILLLTQISFVLSPTPSRADTLSLSRAIDEAMKNNPDLLVARKDMESAKLSSEAPYGAFDPLLDIESSHMNTKKDNVSPFVAEQISGTTHQISLLKRWSLTGGTLGLSARDNYTSNEYSATQLLSIGNLVGTPKYHESEFKVVYEQPLLKGLFATDIDEQIKASDSLWKASKENYLAKADKLILDVSDKYWNTLIAGESVEIRQSALERSQRFLNLVNKRVKLGTAEKLDQLQAKASHVNSKEQLILAELEEKKSRRSLDVTIGRSLGKFTISTSPLSRRLNLSPKNTVVEKAIQSRRDLKAIIEMLNQSQARANLAKENAKPILNAFGTYAGNGLSHGLGEGMNDAVRFRNPSWMVGVRFSTPLGNTTAAAQREAERANVLKSRAEIHKFQMLVRQNAEDVWDSVVTAQKSLAEAEENLKIQKEKLSLAEKRFRQGRASSKLIIDFHNELNFTELDVLSKKARLQKTYTALQVIQGEYHPN